MLTSYVHTSHHQVIVSQTTRQFHLGVSDIFFIQYVADTSHGLQMLYLSPFLSFHVPLPSITSQYRDPFIREDADWKWKEECR